MIIPVDIIMKFEVVPTNLNDLYEEDNHENMRLYDAEAQDLLEVETVLKELAEGKVTLNEAIYAYQNKLSIIKNIRGY